MDLDGDGNDDILSGSYWPGDLFLFRGKADGAFEKGEILKDLEGKNLSSGPPWSSPKKPEMDSLAASPFAFDADGDGVLDLYVGNISGRVILIPNEGTAKKPAFNPKKRRALEAAGTPIQVPGGDAGPFVADWDQDGRPDLLVGAGDGSVWFYRNIGTRQEAKYEKGVALLPACKRKWNSVAEDQEPDGPGLRCKICVTDWNGDGRLDLLVGDFWTQKATPPKLTPEETQRCAELRKRRAELSEKWQDLHRKQEKEGKDDQPSEELTKVEKEMSQNWDDLRKLEPGDSQHGSVWLYLRNGK